jgi:glucose dehydrogenase
MVRCANCVLMEIFHDAGEEYWNRCVLYNRWDMDLEAERTCIDFQPGP